MKFLILVALLMMTVLMTGVQSQGDLKSILFKVLGLDTAPGVVVPEKPPSPCGNKQRLVTAPPTLSPCGRRKRILGTTKSPCERTTPSPCERTTKEPCDRATPSPCNTPKPGNKKHSGSLYDNSRRLQGFFSTISYCL